MDVRVEMKAIANKKRGIGWYCVNSRGEIRLLGRKQRHSLWRCGKKKKTGDDGKYKQYMNWGLREKRRKKNEIKEVQGQNKCGRLGGEEEVYLVR